MIAYKYCFHIDDTKILQKFIWLVSKHLAFHLWDGRNIWKGGFDFTTNSEGFDEIGRFSLIYGLNLNKSPNCEMVEIKNKDEHITNLLGKPF